MNSANNDEDPNKAYSPEEDERRNGQRTRTIYRLVHIGCTGDEGLARCRNISDGGVGLRLIMPVQLNDEITIAFSPTVETIFVLVAYALVAALRLGLPGCCSAVLRYRM